jgi:hypothetical protein
MASPGRALIQTHGQPAKIWMIAIPRHGSKPARTAVIRKPYRIRAEFFALPFAAPRRFASTPIRRFAQLPRSAFLCLRHGSVDQ